MVLANNAIRLREIHNSIVSDQTVFCNIHQVSLSTLKRNHVQMKNLLHDYMEVNIRHCTFRSTVWLDWFWLTCFTWEFCIWMLKSFFCSYTLMRRGTKVKRHGRNIIGHRAIVEWSHPPPCHHGSLQYIWSKIGFMIIHNLHFFIFHHIHPSLIQQKSVLSMGVYAHAPLIQLMKDACRVTILLSLFKEGSNIVEDSHHALPITT